MKVLSAFVACAILLSAYVVGLTLRIAIIAAPFVLAAWAIKHFIF